MTQPSTSSAAPTRRGRKMLEPLIVAALILLGAGAWLATRQAPADAADTAAAARPAAPLTVEFAPADIVQVANRELAHTIAITGTLKPINQATVKSKVSGELLRVLVREGQRVERSEVMAELDTRDLKAQLDQQQGALDDARAKWQIAAKNRANNLQLLKQNFISQNAFDASQSSFESTVGNVRQAEAQVRLAHNAVQDAVIRAPFAGVVARRMVQAGDKAAADSALFTLVDLSRMEIEAPVPATEIPLVKVGQTAKFRVDGFGERVFEGRVERVNPTTNDNSRAINLYLSVPNTDGTLRGGMFAKGSLALESHASMPTIPTTALRGDASRPSVFALEDGKVVERTVTLGLRDDDTGMVEVKTGLSVGQQVVAVKMDNLKAGTPAVVKTPPVATREG